MTKGFYMMGLFAKGKKARSNFDRRKPFEVDHQRGMTIPVVLSFFKQNIVFDEWVFFGGRKISDLNHDTELRRCCNNTWKDWCKKHRRKYNPLLEEIEIKKSNQ